MKKKLITLMLIVCMSITCLTGCGEKKSSNKDTSATMDVTTDVTTEDENSTGTTSSKLEFIYAPSQFYEENPADGSSFCNIKGVSSALLAGVEFKDGEMEGKEVEKFIKNLSDYWNYLDEYGKKHADEGRAATKADWISYQMDNKKIISISSSSKPEEWYAVYGEMPNADTGFVTEIEGVMTFSKDGKSLTYKAQKEPYKYRADMIAVLPQEHQTETTAIVQCNHDLVLKIYGPKLLTKDQAAAYALEILAPIYSNFPNEDINRVYVTFVSDYTRQNEKTVYSYNYSAYTTYGSDAIDNVKGFGGFYPIEYDIARNIIFN